MTVDYRKRCWIGGRNSRGQLTSAPFMSSLSHLHATTVTVSADIFYILYLHSLRSIMHTRCRPIGVMLSSFRSTFFRRSASLFRRTGVRSESTTAAPQPLSQKARRYPWLTPTMVLVGIMPFFTFALGTWQVQRLKWKVNLIDELEEKLRREPLMLPPKIKCVQYIVAPTTFSSHGMNQLPRQFGDHPRIHLP